MAPPARTTTMMAEQYVAWAEFIRKQATTPEGLIRIILLGIIVVVGYVYYEDSKQDRQLKAEYFASQIAATKNLTTATTELTESADSRELFQLVVSKEHAASDAKIEANGRRVDELSQTTLQLVQQIDNTNKLLAVVITLLESSAKNAQGVATPGET